MLGSRYNDKKERLENRRQSFFLAPTDHHQLKHDPSTRRIRSTGTTDTGDHSTATAIAAGTAANVNSSSNSSVTGVRRHTFISKTRSLDSGVVTTTSYDNDNTNQMSGDTLFQANNPQDDYGSTNNTTNGNTNTNNSRTFQKDAPLLVGGGGGGGRSRLLLGRPTTRSSCADLSNIDEKPVRYVMHRLNWRCVKCYLYVLY